MERDVRRDVSILVELGDREDVDSDGDNVKGEEEEEEEEPVAQRQDVVSGTLALL